MASPTLQSLRQRSLSLLPSFNVFFNSSVNDHSPSNSGGLASLLDYLSLHWDNKSSWRKMVEIISFCALLPLSWYLSLGFRRRHVSSGSAQDQESSPTKPDRFTNHSTKVSSPKAGEDYSTNSSDPGLLRKHSSFHSLTTSSHGFTYPRLRIYYRPHPQAAKLPASPPLPLIVFIHGLGGCLAQFAPLMTSLVNLAPCLGVDLPGCGLSTFSPADWEAYTTDALVELLAEVIEQYRDKESDQGIIFVGHSMGCSLSLLLASSTSSHPRSLARHAVGLIAICPRANPPSESEIKSIRKLTSLPESVFNLLRRLDRWGGTESKSVARFVGKGADVDTKRLQLRFNEQSRTPVWRRMTLGLVPVQAASGDLIGGLPGKSVWAGLDLPVFLIAGEEDRVTKPEELDKIAGFLGMSPTARLGNGVGKAHSSSSTKVTPKKSQGSDQVSSKENDETAKETEITEYSNSSRSFSISSGAENQRDRPRRVLKTTILPPPAGHALLYTRSSSRILAGLLSDFMAAHISPHLSLGWQLQYLSKGGKWDVKNLAKWQAVAPVSPPIGGIIRALKTLREVDERHCPAVFVSEWGGKIRHVVDISHESPVYDPRGLEKGGIHYHKFPTVSKMPPTAEEVHDFIELIDRLIAEGATSGQDVAPEKRALIGVHCHYGYNRTGYFIVCYLVERRGYGLQAAIDEFAAKRAPGIRHEHFIDALYVRYCKGLMRSPTL